MTLGTWIKLNHGTHGKLSEFLGKSRHTVNRWYNEDPKRFFLYLPQLKRSSNTDLKDLIQMIEERCDDVQALRG